MMEHKKTTDIVTWTFYIAGLLLISLLTYSKLHQPQLDESWLHHSSTYSHLPHVPRPDIASERIELNDHSFYLSRHPITNAQYRQFVKATGYETWLEHQQIRPNWKCSDSSDGEASSLSWLSSPDAPVRYLTRQDAEAFCMWLGRKEGNSSPHEGRGSEDLWKKTGPRLPGVQELEAMSSGSNDSSWLWTHHIYGKESKEGVQRTKYYTSWRADGKLRHRRTRDMDLEELKNTEFHVAWTLREESRNGLESL